MDASLRNNREATKFVNQYRNEIINLIDNFYGKL